MSGTNASYMNYDPRIVELKSKFECEFRRFSVDRAKMKEFTEFHVLIKQLHCLPDDINFTVSYTDPRNGDLLPINNDDNLLRAYSTAMPLLRLFIYREQDLMLADMSARQRSSRRRYTTEHKTKASLTIGIPQDFRRVSSIVDADMLPDTLRRVKLLKHSSDRPLGFYIRDGTSVRVTPYGLEKVPGIFISRLVPGGLAEGTGLLAVNDEILEVNGIEVTGKSLDQVTDMMVANSHNLIITVKPAQQPAQTPRAQSMANLSGKPKPSGKGSRSKLDGMTQSAKITSRSQGDIPSAIPSTPPSINRSSKRGDTDRHSRTSGRDMMSPLRDHTDSSHHNDVSRARSHGPEITEVYDNDSGMHTSSSSHKYQVPSNPNGIQSPTHETS